MTSEKSVRRPLEVYQGLIGVSPGATDVFCRVKGSKLFAAPDNILCIVFRICRITLHIVLGLFAGKLRHTDDIATIVSVDLFEMETVCVILMNVERLGGVFKADGTVFVRPDKCKKDHSEKTKRNTNDSFIGYDIHVNPPLQRINGYLCFIFHYRGG